MPVLPVARSRIYLEYLKDILNASPTTVTFTYRWDRLRSDVYNRAPLKRLSAAICKRSLVNPISAASSLRFSTSKFIDSQLLNSRKRSKSGNSCTGATLMASASSPKLVIMIASSLPCGPMDPFFRVSYTNL